MAIPRLTLFIGPSEQTAMRLRTLFAEHSDALAQAGVVAPQWNHVRLYAACAAPDAVGILRHKRGLDSPYAQETLTAEFHALLATETGQMSADHVVLAAAQLGSLLHTPSEVSRLRDLLAPYFDEIHVIAYVDEQARTLARHYPMAILEGRRTSLEQELGLARGNDWRGSALAARGKTNADIGDFAEVQAPPFWLDYKGLLQSWEDCFGVGRVALRPLDRAALAGPDTMTDVGQALGLARKLPPSKPARVFAPEPGASLARMRLMNDVMIRLAQARDIFIPYDVKNQIHKAVRVAGDPITPGSLSTVSDHFAADNAALAARFPDLQAALDPDPLQPGWTEADPTMGFRATQYLAAFLPAIMKNAVPLAQKRTERAEADMAAAKFDALMGKDPSHDTLLKRIKVNHQMVLTSHFRPHNDLGSVDEVTPAPAFAPVPPNTPRKGSSGNLIVACMKNESPYIVEWIAYHRSIGFDTFLIYTNDCSDGTDTVLNRLQDMGVLTHRDNNNWKGKSPQQHALNQAMHEPVVQNAAWIAHIDVDEFINIRTGNGTLTDFFQAAPDATNVAMTWRLFGHDGVTELNDAFVIDQFETCAPSFCPKPHTVWGFKTLFRNTGAYGKMSCHRPNKLKPAQANGVTWVNGSGQDITQDTRDNGWRSSKSTVGYDLLQLNHYPLRSAASFLIKRQRGRALHVDRSIGINYWIRMDWSDARDITIKRNIPRVLAEYDRLMADPKLRAAHQAGFAWHRAKAAELRAIPEFAALYDKAMAVDLTASERAAYALALDMES